MDRFDVIIIGMGCGGMTTADRLVEAGRRVAVIERELIGGECSYWACRVGAGLTDQADDWPEESEPKLDQQDA